MARIVVDPVTRIEGHLRVEAVVENGVITDAFSSGTMVRGLEKILIGRDPRDAWAITERVCGVCTTVHALTSVPRRRKRAGNHACRPPRSSFATS
jgi:hydrogenase large subunit